MRCSDCVHYEVCKFLGNLYSEDEGCRHFKRKSCFVELPCEVGQTVWMPFEGEVIPLLIVRISIEDRMGEEVIRCYDAQSAKVATSFCDCHIGKTVFISREEAEKALSKRSK